MDRLNESFFRGFRPQLLLVLLCLALYLPGLTSIPPLDRDEARFAQASHQMLESGDYVTIRFQSELRAKKPAGIYWLQAASAKFTGAADRIWPYRLPSLLGAILAVLATLSFGKATFNAKTGVLGAALLAVTLDLTVEAHEATADAALLATVVIAQAILARVYFAAEGIAPPPPLRLVLCFWVAQAAGILIKGPVTPAISLLTMLALWAADRRAGWLKGLRPVPGTALMLALVLPWAVAVSLATQDTFLGESIRVDFLLKLISVQQMHGAPPGSYLLLSPLLLWPVSIWLIPALARGWRRRHDVRMRFLLAWAVPAWVVFELIPTKLPHYILPCVPALAILAGDALAWREPPERARWVKIYSVLALFAGILLPLAIVRSPELVRAASGVRGWNIGPLVGHALVAGIAGLIAAAMPWLRVPTRYALVPVALAVLATMAMYGAVFAGIMPRLDPIWLSRDLAKAIAPDRPVVLAGYDEPSLIFALAGRPVVTDGAGAARFLLSHPGAEAVIEQKQFPAFASTSMKGGAPLAEQLASVAGLDYSRGHKLRLGVWETAAKP